VITRQLQIDVDSASWGRKPMPAWASRAAPTQTVDVARAMLLLGSLTTPSSLSAGSPERYWACVRYFSACTASRDLRISTPFMDLDPHQKGILSDDFGVAISVSWLVDQLGGIQDIVDGRHFMINMGVRRSASARRLPKVGPRKCPDFVLEDLHGKFHVLECKGTQSGRNYLNRAMATGQVQKRGISVAKAMRGESLVIGLSLAGEGEDRESQLVVIDPEDEPLTVVEESDRQEAAKVLTRLNVARALNLSGFHRMAFEIAWPERLQKSSAEAELLTPGERKRLSILPRDRLSSWQTEFQSEFVKAPQRRVENYFIQEMSFDLNSVKLDSGDEARRVTVRRGLNAELVEKLAQTGKDLRSAASDVVEEAADRRERIDITTQRNGHSARLNYRDLFFTEISFED